jgi:hypothetical protein
MSAHDKAGLMASFDDLFSQIPIAQIAQQLGVDEATATNAVKTALPTLVGGLQANAADADGAASLENALDQHGGLLDGGVDVNQIDAKDGAKIVSNIFGGAQNEVVSALGNTVGDTGGSAGSQLIKQLLPILAPIVLAYLAKQLTGGNNAPAQPAQQQSSGGAIGDILGGLLRSATSNSNSSGGLGGVLGGLLGGNAGGALGDVLGGLLGGGKR